MVVRETKTKKRQVEKKKRKIFHIFFLFYPLVPLINYTFSRSLMVEILCKWGSKKSERKKKQSTCVACGRFTYQLAEHFRHNCSPTILILCWSSSFVNRLHWTLMMMPCVDWINNYNKIIIMNEDWILFFLWVYTFGSQVHRIITNFLFLHPIFISLKVRSFYTSSLCIKCVEWSMNEIDERNELSCVLWEALCV